MFYFLIWRQKFILVALNLAASLMKLRNKQRKIIDMILLHYLGSLFLLTHYSPLLFFIPSKNISKPLGFLMFSGVIEKQHRAVMS